MKQNNIWHPKSGDIVVFKTDDRYNNCKNTYYKIVRTWKDPNKTVELIRLTESELGKVIFKTIYAHPILKHVAADLQSAVNEIITSKFLNYDWELEEVENDIIITQEQFLVPAGKTYFNLTHSDE